MSDRRRQLLEEILEARSRVVAQLPVDVDEAHPTSPLWPLGVVRLATTGLSGSLLSRRRRAVLIGVVALAWLESIDTLGLPAGGELNPGPTPEPRGH